MCCPNTDSACLYTCEQLVSKVILCRPKRMRASHGPRGSLSGTYPDIIQAVEHLLPSGGLHEVLGRRTVLDVHNLATTEEGKGYELCLSLDCRVVACPMQTRLRSSVAWLMPRCANQCSRLGLSGRRRLKSGGTNACSNMGASGACCEKRCMLGQLVHARPEWVWLLDRRCGGASSSSLNMAWHGMSEAKDAKLVPAWLGNHVVVPPTYLHEPTSTAAYLVTWQVLLQQALAEGQCSQPDCINAKLPTRCPTLAVPSQIPNTTHLRYISTRTTATATAAAAPLSVVVPAAHSHTARVVACGPVAAPHSHTLLLHTDGKAVLP